MAGKIVIAGALDTKGPDFTFVRDRLHARGVETLVIDFGLLGKPAFTPDITQDEVARAGGHALSEFADGLHKDVGMQTMADGLAKVVADLHEKGEVAGMISMGGTGGTSVATAGMRALPIGVPKVMVSTLGGGDVSAYTGFKDITFIPSVVDVAGLNRISRVIYARAADAVAGMVAGEPIAATEDRPLIAASMFGNTTKCVTAAKEIMEKAGYEVLVFHCTGTGGKTMEGLVSEGLITGVLDITTTELADNVCGGVLDAGPDRGQAAPKAGLPTVIVPGCVDMANFWAVETMPKPHQTRNLYRWNANMTLLRTNEAENREMGHRLAVAANMATGPVAILLPLKGVSELDSDGNQFWDPAADRACYQAIRETIRADIPIHEVDANINDPEFSSAVAQTLLDMMGVTHQAV